MDCTHGYGAAGGSTDCPVCSRNDFAAQDALQAAADEMGVDLTAGDAACILLALESGGWELARATPT